MSGAPSSRGCAGRSIAAHASAAIRTVLMIPVKSFSDAPWVRFPPRRLRQPQAKRKFREVGGATHLDVADEVGHLVLPALCGPGIADDGRIRWGGSVRIRA